MQPSAPGARVMPAHSMRNARSVVHDNARSGKSHDSRLRRRKPLACEACYRRKIKCEYESSHDTCIQCMRRNLNCKTISGNEKTDSSKRSHYVKTLEERLRKTESLLRTAGILVESPDIDNGGGTSDDDDDNDSAMEDGYDVPADHLSGHREESAEVSSHTLCSHNTSIERDSPLSEAKRQSSELDTLPKLLQCSRPTTGKSGPPGWKADKESSLYIGRSTPLSILTREGVEWIKSRSGEANSLNTLLSNSKFDSPWAYWRPDVFHDVFASKVFKPLPPRAEVFSMLQDYFRTVNLIFPLYHEDTFMQLVEWQYTQQTCDDAARWASINIILALAYEYRFSNSQKSEKDREKAWLYYKNALSVYSELVLRRTDLLSVQALLGMALFLRGNSGTQSTVPIVTAAIRSSHRMGLHRAIPRPYLSETEQEQRKKVFWIAYILDQSISIRLGNAPTQHFDDFDVDFPSDETSDCLIMADNKPFFPQICRLALIRSRIYHYFYSARALENKTTANICEMIHKLHAELQEWKSSSQFDTLFKQRGTGEDFLAGFASAGLFLLYYNSLIMIHRLPMLINFIYQSRSKNIPELDLRLILNQSSCSAAVCVQAARDTLKLVNNLPWGDVAWIWSLLYFVFLAVMTIFANILRNSQQPTAKDDLQSLNMAATFFATLVPADGPCNYARFMTRMSTTFERIARTVLERDQKSIKAASESKTKSSKSRTAVHAPLQPQPPPRSTSSSSPSNPSSSTSRTTTATTTTVNIPNLEGLPPINSSGYVVPKSPTPTPSPSPSSSPTATTRPKSLQEHAQRSHAAAPPATTTHYQPQPQIHANANAHPFMPSNLNLNLNMPFPLPSFTESSLPFAMPMTQPDLWQIPLSADWELGFGGQFLGSMLGNPHPNADPHSHSHSHPGTIPNSGPDDTYNSASASMPTSMPATTGQVPLMGYGYEHGSVNSGHQNQHHGGHATAHGNHHPSTMWMNGNYGHGY
ncbi:fungal-specific transcription factor domain-containing protein [Aspergillus karnatakaensis]|uniref:transcription factor domain-containing protein n=1 Tax=Aspergillus karnatakaensis TaxID=1810916 RepID=UPI003CCCD2D6